MSKSPFGSHGLSKDPFYSQQLSDTGTARIPVPMVRSSTVVSNNNKDWIFFAEGVPGFLFRITADIQTRNAAVSSADFEVSTQEGIFPSIPTISQPTNVPATWIKGRASLLDRSCQDVVQAMRPRWRLVSCRLRLGQGKDSQGNVQAQEDIEGYCVVGSGPIWAIANADEEHQHGESRDRVSSAKLVLGKAVERVKIFLFAPRRLIIDQIGLCDGQFTTVSGFEVATYRYEDGDNGLGGVLLRRRGRIQIGRRLPGYSFKISSQGQLAECLRFGGGQGYSILADCTMKVHIEDWQAAFEVEGYAVTCADDGPDLCDRIVTQLDGGIVQKFLGEWERKLEELYAPTNE